MAIQIQVKRGVDANRPALAAGEFYNSTDTKALYVGPTPSAIPVVSAEVHLTAQAAAISATTLLTPSASGMYRINAYLKVTRAATTSSTLGALTIAYTDATDSVAQSQVCGMQTQAGAFATTNSGNSTASKLSGCIVVNAKVGVAITYAIAYTSSGTTTMQYEAHLQVEVL